MFHCIIVCLWTLNLPILVQKTMSEGKDETGKIKGIRKRGRVETSYWISAISNGCKAVSLPVQATACFIEEVVA